MNPRVVAVAEFLPLEGLLAVWIGTSEARFDVLLGVFLEESFDRRFVVAVWAFVERRPSGKQDTVNSAKSACDMEKNYEIPKTNAYHTHYALWLIPISFQQRRLWIFVLSYQMEK